MRVMGKMREIGEMGEMRKRFPSQQRILLVIN